MAWTKWTLSRHRKYLLPGLVSLSLVAGTVVSIVATQGAQADYYIGCGFGYSSDGTFGSGVGYGYGYDLNGDYGFGYGNQVCPPSSGSGSSGSGATTTTTAPTTTTTTTNQTTTTTLRKQKKHVPSLLGLHVYFANWSAVLSKHYKNLLDNLASEIIADHTRHITITGYASVVGDTQINVPLSLLRAETVENYLMGVLSSRGYSSISFSVSGGGVLQTFSNYALDRVVIITS
jgi:outer membrane protein OmpA-like peptidoglycan-associated protein